MNIEKDCISPTLRAESHNNEPIVFHTMQDPITSETVTPCLSSGSPNGQAVVGVNVDYAVRRLTPLECERLQGYPDGWTDIGEWVDTNGKTHAESTDSARYKAIGNRQQHSPPAVGVCSATVKYLLRRRYNDGKPV